LIYEPNVDIFMIFDNWFKKLRQYFHKSKRSESALESVKQLIQKICTGVLLKLIEMDIRAAILICKNLFVNLVQFLESPKTREKLILALRIFFRTVLEKELQGFEKVLESLIDSFFEQCTQISREIADTYLKEIIKAIKTDEISPANCKLVSRLATKIISSSKDSEMNLKFLKRLMRAIFENISDKNNNSKVRVNHQLIL
jgi:hypothetical protein